MLTLRNVYATTACNSLHTGMVAVCHVLCQLQITTSDDCLLYNNCVEMTYYVSSGVHSCAYSTARRDGRVERATDACSMNVTITHG